MKHMPIDLIANEWSQMSHDILDLKKLSLNRINTLLKETYRILSIYTTDELIPRDICKLIFYMEEFLYFSELMEEKEKGKGYYYFEEFRYLIDTLRDGFFKKEYSNSYPKLIVSDIMDNSYLLDFEEGNFESYVAAVRQGYMDE